MGLRKQRSYRRGSPIPPHAIESVAENMKERVYATITIIAVIVALWQTANHHTVRGVIASIAGTSAALWLATLVAARVSHHAVKGKGMTLHDWRKLLFTSSGLFAPAVLPIILVLQTKLGWMTLKSALYASIVALLLSLFVLSFTSGRRIYTNPLKLLLLSTIEMSVGIGVVILKLAVGE